MRKKPSIFGAGKFSTKSSQKYTGVLQPQLHFLSIVQVVYSTGQSVFFAFYRRTRSFILKTSKGILLISKNSSNVLELSVRNNSFRKKLTSFYV